MDNPSFWTVAAARRMAHPTEHLLRRGDCGTEFLSLSDAQSNWPDPKRFQDASRYLQFAGKYLQVGGPKNYAFPCCHVNLLRGKRCVW